MKSIVAALSIAAWLCACVSTDQNRAIQGFDASREDVGARKQVCGYKKGLRIYSGKSDDALHYEIMEVEPISSKQDDYLCLTGEIVYLGCETGSVMCVDWSSDFGLKAISLEDENRK